MSKTSVLSRRRGSAAARHWLVPVFGVALVSASSVQSAGIQITYLWHLHQPIYWNDQKSPQEDRYEYAWESIQAKDGGRVHPMDNLREIFGKDDRRIVYQGGANDCLTKMPGQPNAGAQLTYSGALIENVRSLGNAGQLGYGSGWSNAYRQARSWNTSNGHPRLDIVNFSYHHGLLPLLSERTVEMELRLMREQMARTWGTERPLSRGFFPTEMCFSERLIPVLKRVGIEWVIVSNSHLSRACVNFPLVTGSGGENCDPPNRADQLNPAQAQWHRKSIDRGCSPANAYPFAYTPHRAQWVNPNTGAVETIIVVPAAQAESWDDGYRCFGPADVNPIAGGNNPNRPMLLLLAHDGDNAFGGGYSYYNECVPNFLQQALQRGWSPTTVEEYLRAWPVPANDIVKVEDGGWVNADSDFGSPIFINWNFPLLDASGNVDPENGWHEKERDMAIFTACENIVRTAEQIDGRPVRLNKIMDPDGSTTPVERAWHYYLGSLDSGNVYFGPALDLEVKATIGCNEAVRRAKPLIQTAQDNTNPTIWLPQRHPYNPGGLNFGVQYGYRQYISNGDFHVWTFAYDTSGIARAEFKYRIDNDGTNPLSSTQNETYAGGPEVGPWQTLPMTRRVFPKGNVYNNPNINFFELPDEIADHYWVKIVGLRSVLIDYYVEMEDTRGNVARAPIQHVYIGDGSGATTSRVTTDPSPPVAGAQATLSYDPSGGPLAGSPQVYIHIGFNGWTNIVTPDPAMTYNSQTSRWTYTFTVPANATRINCVFRNANNVWDNNGGQDYNINTATGPTNTPTHTHTPGGPTSTPTATPSATRTPTATPTRAPGDFVMDGVLDAGVPQRSSVGMKLWAAIDGDFLYVATDDAGEGNDNFILVSDGDGPVVPAPWGKQGTVAGRDAFLADENDNNFSGWFDGNGTLLEQGALGARQASGNGAQVLEGVINLRQLFGGTLPPAVYLAAAAYGTQDGDTLIAAAQAPASVNGDGNVDANEYFMLPLGAPDDADNDGVPDAVEGWPPQAGQGNRHLSDSDGDGWSDGHEDANKNGRYDAGELNLRNADTDGDGIEDRVEARMGSDPRNAASPAGPLVDNDNDRLPAGVDPNDSVPDMDGDRYADGYEYAVLGLAAVTAAPQRPALGDLYADGVISNVDALVAQSLFLGIASPDAFATGNGDGNRDGHVSNADALIVQSYFLNLLPRLPAGL